MKIKQLPIDKEGLKPLTYLKDINHTNHTLLLYLKSSADKVGMILGKHNIRMTHKTTKQFSGNRKKIAYSISGNDYYQTDHKIHSGSSKQIAKIQHQKTRINQKPQKSKNITILNTKEDSEITCSVENDNPQRTPTRKASYGGKNLITQLINT